MAYQFKDSEAYTNITIALDHFFGIKLFICFLSESSHYAYQLFKMKHRTPCLQMFCPFPVWDQTFFSEEGSVPYHIMQFKV